MATSVAPVEPESWITAAIDHALSTMTDERRGLVFRVAEDRYAEQLAAGQQPDLLDVFMAATRDVASWTGGRADIR